MPRATAAGVLERSYREGADSEGSWLPALPNSWPKIARGAQGGRMACKWAAPAQAGAGARGSPRGWHCVCQASPVLVLMFSVPTVCPIRWYWFSLEPSSATTTDLVVSLVQT